MYLISVYFDEKSNKKMQHYIHKIAKQTGNDFMISHKVPPHLTISAIEVRDGETLIPHMKNLQDNLQAGEVSFVSVGALLPYVLYITPVLNKYLQTMSQTVYDVFANLPQVSINRFYQPMQWLPHVTLGKTLKKEQMQTAFQIMQEDFVPFEAEIIQIGLAKTNPHEDIFKIELK